MEESQTKTTCNHYVSRKNRYCRMLVAKGNQYCGQHLVYDKASQSSGRIRIFCPLDPKHTCYKDQLPEHMKNCNARKVARPFDSENINLNSTSDVLKQSLSDISDSKLLNLIAKIDEAHLRFIGQLNQEIYCHKSFAEELLNPSYGNSVIRHLKQNASIVGHLENICALDICSSTCFIEFGAGRGQLTYWISNAISNIELTKFLIVERGAQRYKFDSKLKYRPGIHLHRLRIDIQHLNLMKVDSVQHCERVVAAGKHLCGAAIDLSLTCLLQLVKIKCISAVLTTCCHHRCTWPSYIGKDFMKEANITPDEFYLILAVTSWAVCQGRDSLNRPPCPDEHGVVVDSSNSEDLKNRYTRLNLPTAKREEVGLKAKQLLDFGRVHYLNGRGFPSHLVQYTEKEWTPESTAIIWENKS